MTLTYGVAAPSVRRLLYLVARIEDPTVRLILLFFIIGFVQSLLDAQSPSYVHYGVTEGLPSNKVYCALQDYRGFIWFGTDKGLARFDGTRFQVYGAKEGLPDLEVLNLFEDSRHRLWISCFGQKPCYLVNGRLITVKNDSVLAEIDTEPGLWEFYEDSNHWIWITGRGKFAFVFQGDTILKELFPASIAQVRQFGSLIVGVGNKFILQRETGLAYEVNSLQRIFISAAVSGNHILYSFTGKLFLFEWKDNRIEAQATLEHTEGRVFTDKKGRFWLCPDSKGAICFDHSPEDLSGAERYLAEEKVNAMMEDGQGTLWFCTSGNGVYALSSGKAATFTKAHGLSSNNITAIARNRQGQILAGDDVGNVYAFSGKTFQKTALTAEGEYNRCRQIIPLHDTCWVANDKGLYYQVDHAFTKITGVKRPYVGFKTILAMPGRLWYGNHHSVGFIAPELSEPVLIVNHRTTALGHDAEGNVWAGRLDGLFSQSDSFLYNWGDRFPLLKTRIVTIQDAGQGKIWIVTPDGGLLRGTAQAGKLVALEQINANLSRPIENIQSLFVESAAPGRVWMATNSGVYGLDPANWSVTHFDQHDGLADNDVSSVLVANDTLWAGTVAGLSFLPLLQQHRDTDFGTFITGLHYQSGGQSFLLQLLDSTSGTHRVLLPPDAAMATLDLAGLNYRNQGGLRYECITTHLLLPTRWLTRHNLLRWIKNGFSKTADTTLLEGNSLPFGVSLPAGNYQVKLTAISTKGVYSQRPDEWTIVMRPYWYNTVWFELLIWGVIAFIIWRILHARTAYRKLNSAVSELQLQALQSQINPHFVGNSINAIQQFFYPPDPASASNYIELFTRLLRRTIVLSEQHFNPFEDELAYDHDYLEMIKLRFGTRFQYEITGAGTIPRDLPFPSMLLQPVLENATIHGLAPEGISHLKLHFSYEQGSLRCQLTDNGMGYKASLARPVVKQKEQKSKGLELLQKKVLAFNRLYDIGLRLELSDLSEAQPPGQGTQVLIAFYPENISKKRPIAILQPR